MVGHDDFHKRLDRIQERLDGGNAVDRAAPTALRGRKIGLVREDEEQHPIKVGAIVWRLLLLSFVGLVSVRIALAAFADMGPEALDLREAELWAEEGVGSKVNAATLRVLGAGDRFLQPVFDRVVSEELGAPAANATSSEADEGKTVEPMAEMRDTSVTSPTSSVNEDVIDQVPIASGTFVEQPSEPALPAPIDAAGDRELSILKATSARMFVDPEPKELRFLQQLIEAFNQSQGATLVASIPDIPPSGWQMMTARDVLAPADGYMTTKATWDRANMPTPWAELPYMGSFLATVGANEASISDNRRYIHYYFSAGGEAILIEYLVLPAGVSAEGLLPAEGSELFVQSGDGGFRFQSDGTYQDGTHHVFVTALSSRVLMAAVIANGSNIALRDFLQGLPIHAIAKAGDQIAQTE